jgi:hypothetical protein
MLPSSWESPSGAGGGGEKNKLNEFFLITSRLIVD